MTGAAYYGTAFADVIISSARFEDFLLAVTLAANNIFFAFLDFFHFFSPPYCKELTILNRKHFQRPADILTSFAQIKMIVRISQAVLHQCLGRVNLLLKYGYNLFRKDLNFFIFRFKFLIIWYKNRMQSAINRRSSYPWFVILFLLGGHLFFL